VIQEGRDNRARIISIPYPCLPGGMACGENVATRKRIPRSACPDLREFRYFRKMMNDEIINSA
jgi:hypothetical protein